MTRPATRCRAGSGASRNSRSSIIQIPAPVPDHGENASLGRNGGAVGIIRTNAAGFAVISIASTARPIATRAADKRRSATDQGNGEPEGASDFQSQERGGQRQVCSVRLSDAVSATTAVAAIVSGAADRWNARFPRNALSWPAAAGCVPPYEALPLCCTDRVQWICTGSSRTP